MSSDFNTDKLKIISDQQGQWPLTGDKKKKIAKKNPTLFLFPLLSSKADLHSSAASVSRMTRRLNNETRPPAVNNKSELRN